jgi:preprotein translocase subunit SecA
MLGKIKELFDFNAKQVARIQKMVDGINALEAQAQALQDTDFPKETEKLKKQVQSNEKTLDEVLPWAYALVREASFRVLGLRHFDEQLIAGIVLHEGNVGEQKTGEGKTLSATAPLYLNALAGRGAHLVTVNDYLARRDAGWMGQLYAFLGLQVSAMISEASFMFDPEYVDKSASDWRFIHLRPISRKEAYEADITYGINSEFGFDYLRDNMAKLPSQIVQRDFYYAIIDEVDSVLIDEARTPHIISAAYDQDVSRYYDYARIVNRLDESDYVIDEKLKTAHINEQGIEKIEKMLGVSNVYEKDYDTLFHVEAALKARTLFAADKDYIVRNGEVVIVDEFTGRLLEGRRYSEGLHQAIEAKEGVEIKRESRTLATVSLQNYFRMYEKLGGMTGTAQTEAEEFNKIYKLDTVVIPTHRSIQRKDHPDLIFKTEGGKYKAVAEMVAELHKAGRPVLIGTTSIDKNEKLSRLLKKKGIPHELLNAKNHEKEAHIIAKAGTRGAVTVATNMAGRGVDIELGGESPNRFNIDPKKSKKEAEKEYAKLKDTWQKKHDDVVELGGLYVISTERHESRRIDNQLRGRAGRQGDPGETRFYVSLNDDLMRIFGGEQVTRVMDMFNMPEDQPIEHGMITRALEQAQSKVEGFNFDTRKNLVEYDDVLNKQREILYKIRRSVLLGEKVSDLEDEVYIALGEQLDTLLNIYVYAGEEPDYETMARELDVLYPGNAQDILEKMQGIVGQDEVREMLVSEFRKVYEQRKKNAGEEVWLNTVRYLFIDTIDTFWTEHLTAIDDLRSGINLRGYAQLDPLTEYKNEAFSMFEKLLSDINFEVVRRIVQIRVDEETSSDIESRSARRPEMRLKAGGGVDVFGSPQQPQVSSPMGLEEPSLADQVRQPAQIAVRPAGQAQKKKPGRNDPCWCGSGKKYKKCHYPD